MDLYRFWKSCPWRLCLLLKVTTYPVSNRLIRVERPLPPVWNKKWACYAWMSMRNIAFGFRVEVLRGAQESYHGLYRLWISYAALFHESLYGVILQEHQGGLILSWFLSYHNNLPFVKIFSYLRTSPFTHGALSKNQKSQNETCHLLFFSTFNP